MTMNMVRLLKSVSVIFVAGSFVAGCVTADGGKGKKQSNATTGLVLEKIKKNKASAVKKIPPPEFNLRSRMTTALPKPVDMSPKPLKGTYSFQAEGMDMASVLAMFARAHKLNIVPDPDVQGVITVNFKDLPFDKAMEAILDAHGFFWEWERGLIRVHKFESKMFTLDYVRLIREGKTQSSASMSSSGSSGGGGGGGRGGGGSGGGAAGGSTSIKQEDKLTFWADFEMQLKGLMSQEQGRKLVVNRLSGIIYVTDLHSNISTIETFINSIDGSIHRQVEIEARIYEVTLNDDYSLGVDWTKIGFDNGRGVISSSSIIAAPVGAVSAKAFSLGANYSRGNFAGVLSALKEQGDIKIISQPRLLTLNNQPALIKVGTDHPFFEAQVTEGSSNNRDRVSITVRYVTIGVVLSVTPQISQDGWIILDISPSITRLVGTDRIVDNITLLPLATAPVIDVKQSSTLVRLRDREMVVISGLIQEETSDTVRKVPLLGDIPGVGKLFTGTYKSTSKRELIVFLTPKIIN